MNKVRFIESWRTYRVGDVIEQGFYVHLPDLVKMGVAVEVTETETPERPAKLARKAADKLAAGAKSLFGA